MTEQSLEAALRWATQRLAAAGIERARNEARLLLRHVTGLSSETQLAHQDERLKEQQKYEGAVLERAARIPLAHITGWASFWDLELRITPHVLVPRPETETIIEASLARAAPKRVLDVGTGSGCLLVTLLRNFPDAIGLATDRSPEALACAQANLEEQDLNRRGLVAQCDWLDAAGKPFDLIVSNPPYLSAADMASLQPEVAREPAAALDGGLDGLEAFRQLARRLGRVLDKEAHVLLEVGRGQADAVEAIFKAHGFIPAGRHRDLAGIERVVALDSS
ncbi:MAG: peptide chain release factor N(5)-glutamine methyltransferase [Pseudomonadota bacterium]